MIFFSLSMRVCGLPVVSGSQPEKAEYAPPQVDSSKKSTKGQRPPKIRKPRPFRSCGVWNC